MTTDTCPGYVVCSSDVLKSEKSTEDSSRLSAWLSQLGLSSRLAEYSSLLHSVSAPSSCSSETALCTTVGTLLGATDMVGVSPQEFTTSKSFVLRPLPPVGLNTLMSIKRSVSTSPHSVTRRSLLNDSKMVPCSSVSSSATQCHALSHGGTSVAKSHVNSQVCACSSSAVAFSSGLLKPSSIPFASMTAVPDSVFLSTLASTTETSHGCSGNFLSAVSTEMSSELLKLPTVPSVVVTPDVDSVFVSASTTALETNCENFVSNLRIVSASSPRSTCSEVRKTSTPAKRPQSLDVIPWAPLSRSPCTLTGSLSTVVHSRVTSSSSLSAATEVIPASPFNIPAV